MHGRLSGRRPSSVANIWWSSYRAEHRGGDSANAAGALSVASSVVPEFQTSPGIRDLLPPESARLRRFVDAFDDVVDAGRLRQVVPPLLEDLGVFQRVGEATDIVTKEMYDFVDKGGRHVALRPEQTASVCRAFVQHRPPTPWKVWYAGPNFRYEKPQRGRYRQFDQVGIEVLGVRRPVPRRRGDRPRVAVLRARSACAR